MQLLSQPGEKSNTEPNRSHWETLKHRLNVQTANDDSEKHEDNSKEKLISFNSNLIPQNKDPSDTISAIQRKSLTDEFSDSICKIDTRVEEFVQEMISTISEMGNGNRNDSVKKIRGIIKKTLCMEKENCGNVIYMKRNEKPKNRVHFSEENITIEIPRAPENLTDIAGQLFSYYCCFGFLFPNA